MQFKVPQDVQQADKIVSFLTLPQLIICIIGFSMAYGTYAALSKQGLPFILWLPPVLVIGALTFSFAFLKIANLPFHQYLALLIERFITPSKRVWVKGGDRVIDTEIYVSQEDKKVNEKAKQLIDSQTEKEEKFQKISEITDILDSLKKEPETSPLEPIDTAADDELLQKSFFESKPTVSTPKPVTVEEKIKAISMTPLTNTGTAQPEKKRKRRRRRRKKNSTESKLTPIAPVQTKPEQEIRTPITPVQTNPEAIKQEPIKQAPAVPVQPKTEPVVVEPPNQLTPNQLAPITPTQAIHAEEANIEEVKLPIPEELLEEKLPAPEVEMELPAPTPSGLKKQDIFTKEQLEKGAEIIIPKKP